MVPRRCEQLSGDLRKQYLGLKAQNEQLTSIASEQPSPGSSEQPESGAGPAHHIAELERCWHQLDDYLEVFNGYATLVGSAMAAENHPNAIDGAKLQAMLQTGELQGMLAMLQTGDPVGSVYPSKLSVCTPCCRQVSCRVPAPCCRLAILQVAFIVRDLMSA